MAKEVNYLDIEGGDHEAGSWNALVDELVQLVRFIRTDVIASEAPEYMQRVRVLEGKLQQAEGLGETDRQYFDEVWEALENEPPPDDAHVFTVFALHNTEQGAVVMMPTEATYHQHQRAVHWIREHGEQGQQYVIQEVFQT